MSAKRAVKSKNNNGGTYSSHGNRSNKVRVLVDMDGVMCDFEGRFLDDYKKMFPDAPVIPLSERRTFYIDDQYREMDPSLGEKTREIWLSPGFFKRMEPIPGAIEAVKEMSGMPNVEVYLCTSALTTWSSADDHFSAKEKFEWVHNHLGRDWLRNLVITRDKTIVQGDILIDDKHRITGAEKHPSWDHVLFTSCHNAHLDISSLRCVRRLENWTDGTWRDLVRDYVSKKLA